MKTLSILLLICTSAHAGMDFTKLPSDNTQIVGTNEVAFVRKQSDILTAYLSVCIVALVPSKGMAHFLPILDREVNVDTFLFTMLSWLAPEDEVIIVPSGKVPQTDYTITPDMLKGFIQHRMGIKNVKTYPCHHERGRTVRISEDYWNVIEHDTVGASMRAFSHVERQ